MTVGKTLSSDGWIDNSGWANYRKIQKIKKWSKKVFFHFHKVKVKDRFGKENGVTAFKLSTTIESSAKWITKISKELLDSDTREYIILGQ